MTRPHEVRREFLEAGPDGRRILAELDRRQRRDQLTLVWRLPFPWLLVLIVLAAWWPLVPWWQSDDFIALHYSQDLGSALSDFFGNQYGLEGVTWFYRPLITLSFALEQLAAGGPFPFGSHLTNAIVHALCAALVGVLGARFLGNRRGFVAGLLWGLLPSHTTAVMWAVGRVDVHSAFWILLALVLGLRALDRGRRTIGVGSIIAAALAFGTKESALVLPGAMALAAFAAARPGRRLVRLRRTWPVFVVAGAYLGLRFLLFGQVLGGYTAGQLDPVAMAAGFGDKLFTLVDPLRLARGDYLALPDWAVWLGLLPVAWSLVAMIVRGRIGLLVGLALALLGAATPAYQFWALDGGLDLQRYMYLPAIAAMMLIAAGGPIPGLLAIAVIVLPSIELHRDWTRQHKDSHAIHSRLIETHREFGDRTPFFVAGLPRSNAAGTTIAFDLGVDRLLRPPFVQDDGRDTFALRPLGQQRDVRRLPYGDERGLPFRDADSLGFTGPTIVAALPPPALSDVEVRYEGPSPLTPADVLAVHEQRRVSRLVLTGVTARYHRVTLFTAGGYLTVIVPGRGEEGGDGVIDLRDVLLARYVERDAADEYHVAFALEVPTALDLKPAFPVLVEPGDFDPGSGVFVPRFANRHIVWLEFDRGYSEFIRGRPPGD